jgi:hypothetical protein
VDVKDPAGRNLQNIRPQYLSVRHRNHCLGAKRTQLGYNFRITQRVWLNDGYPQIEGRLLDCRARRLAAAAGGPVRLCYNRQDRVAVGVEAAERRHGEGRCSDEKDAHEPRIFSRQPPAKRKSPASGIVPPISRVIWLDI